MNSETDGAETRRIAAEQITVAAARLARTAIANGLTRLAASIERVVIEAWQEASGPDTPQPDGGSQPSQDPG